MLNIVFVQIQFSNNLAFRKIEADDEVKAQHPGSQGLMVALEDCIRQVVKKGTTALARMSGHFSAAIHNTNPESIMSQY